MKDAGLIERLSITVLADNVAGGRGLLAEHGLALWIEADDLRILFDTGQGLVLLPNAETLGIDLKTADALVLSHGHYDHAGGLAKLMPGLGCVRLYAHPQAFAPKYVQRPDGSVREAGASSAGLETIRPWVRELIETLEPVEPVPGVWVSGEIPRRTAYEDTGGAFHLDQAARVEDPLVDDQALFVCTASGLVVITGCAHAGVINTVEAGRALTGMDQVRAVIGGFHLLRASEERLSRTLEALADFGIRRVGPAHCTGSAATARLREAFPEGFMELCTGARVNLD